MLMSGTRQGAGCRKAIYIAGLMLLTCGLAWGQSTCPGRYCGRVAIDSNSTSACGSCPRGSRVQNQTLCMECQEPLSIYQWLYLLFMALVPLSFNFITTERSSITHEVNMFRISNVLEVSVSAILALLSFRPTGDVALHTCGVSRVSDWYPIFFNPSPDFFNTIHCTSEVVYPMYSIVFVFSAYYLLLVLTARPILVYQFSKAHGTIHLLYDILFFLPFYILTHAIAGGLVYYAYPYLTIIFSLLSSALFFASSVTNGDLLTLNFIVITLLYTCMHAFGIAAFVTFYGVTHLWPLLALSPAPTLVFLLTLRFSNPDALKCRLRS